MGYTDKQIATIRAAVAEGREAMRLQEKFDPLVFARAFVQHHGVCIPGESEDSTRRIKSKGFSPQRHGEKLKSKSNILN